MDRPFRPAEPRWTRVGRGAGVPGRPPRRPSPPGQEAPPRRQLLPSAADDLVRSIRGGTHGRIAARHPHRHGRPARAAVPADPRPPAGPGAAPRRAGRAGRGLRAGLLQQPSLLAVPHRLHGRRAAVAHRGLRQRGRGPIRHPHLRPLPAPSRLPHGAVGQDAFLWAGPAPRLRGAADHRHLSRRLRLDARLGAADAAAELVPQHVVGGGSRPLRPDQPDGQT